MKKLNILLFFIILQNIHAQNIIDVYCSNDSCSHIVIDPEMLVVERWDTLPQSKFWTTVINTSKDICIINIASNRQILDYIDRDFWFSKSEEEKKGNVSLEDLIIKHAEIRMRKSNIDEQADSVDEQNLLSHYNI